jgi:hypothetical protein
MKKTLTVVVSAFNEEHAIARCLKSVAFADEIVVVDNTSSDGTVSIAKKWWPDRQIRLFRRGKGQFPCIHIHEYIKVDGGLGELAEPYVHYNYESVHQYLTKIDRASSSEAIYLKETNYQLVWFDAIRFPVSDFLKIYFAQRGYRDGLHGLVLSLFQAFYSFCVFAKAWEMQGFPERDIQSEAVMNELERNGRDARYWILTVQITEAKNYFSKLVSIIKRKLNRIHA